MPARMRSNFGAAPISPAVGAQIAVIAAATAALNVVEIGTGAGVSGPGCCTAHPARLSPPSTRSPSTWLRRTAFADAKVLPARARFITGLASDVLPR